MGAVLRGAMSTSRCCWCPSLLLTQTLMLFFFLFNDTAPTEIYPLSLHDALPISVGLGCSLGYFGGWKRSGDEEKCVLIPERPIRLRQSGHLVHNRRRSFNLCWFPECSPTQIVDHLASKVVIW